MSIKQEESEEQTSNHGTLICVIVVLAVFCAIAVWKTYDYYFSQIQIPKNQNLDDIGAFLGTRGDYFGGILNPIFALFSFLALLYTIFLQTRELELTRKEFTKSVDAQRKSERALSQQTFENTFFNMLNLHGEITKSIEIDIHDLLAIVIDSDFARRVIRDYVSQSGRDILHGRQAITSVVDIMTFQAEDTDENFQKQRYINIQRYRNDLFGHYFRNLFQIIKFVDEYDEDSGITKNKYTKLLRAQLSSAELILLYYNCLKGVVDNGEFARLLIKYEMLKHLDLKLSDEATTNTPTDKLELMLLINGNSKSHKNDVLNYVLFDENNTTILGSAFGESPLFKRIKNLLIEKQLNRTYRPNP